MTPARRRVLVVAPFAPRIDGRSGGEKVMARTVAALADAHEIGVVYLRGPGEDDVDLPAGCCALVRAVERPWALDAPGRWIRQWRLAAGLAGGTPLWPGRWWSPACASAIREAVESWQPEIVQFEYHVMGQYAEAIGERPARILVDHDPGEAAARDTQMSARGTAAVAASADVRAWRKYQRRVMKAVDRVVVFTDRDRAALLPYAGSTPVVRIPFGVDLPADPANPLGADPPTLLFVGNFRHPPNDDAARHLVEGILPSVRRIHPAVQAAIVGAHPPDWLLAIKEDGVVEVPGAVDDLRPWIDRAALVVMPLRLGGGMRLKTLEALAAGKAIVASPLAVEGLDVEDGQQLRIARTDREFVDCIAGLLGSPDDRRRLAGSARGWAATHASWKQLATAYGALYTAVLSEHSSVGRSNSGTRVGIR